MFDFYIHSFICSVYLCTNFSHINLFPASFSTSGAWLQVHFKGEMNPAYHYQRKWHTSPYTCCAVAT